MVFSFKLISGEIVQHQVKTDVVTIGRSKSCTIVAPYDGISRNHCQINFENGEIFVTDLGSTNGVFIDGTKVEPNVKTPYQTYLTFSIGSIQSITIEFDDKTSVNSPSSLNQYLSQNSDHISKDNDITATKAYSSEVQKTQKETVLKLKTPPAKESASPRSNQKESPKKKTEEKNTLVKPLIILLLIAAVVWFFTQDENADQPGEIESTKSSNSSEKNYEQF
jgi:pSer/pThr/pTyr-binding forkhead associated (FHA) protein